jgi:hypothetical protein
MDKTLSLKKSAAYAWAWQPPKWHKAWERILGMAGKIRASFSG